MHDKGVQMVSSVRGGIVLGKVERSRLNVGGNSTCMGCYWGGWYTYRLIIIYLYCK